MAVTPFEAAGIAFVAGDRVLMLKRPDGVWGLPFGKVEAGETTVQAAIRETFEEVGQVITTPLTFLYRNRVGDCTSTCYLCKCEPFNPVLNEEHSEFIWAPINNIPTPTFPAISAALNGETVTMDEADSARQFDINGWMEIDANPLSKVGVYPYLGKNIKGAPDPAAFYNVYRPAEELSDPECIESFKLIPWVDDHAMLGDGERLTKPEDKGIEGVIGERVFFDPEYGTVERPGTLKSNIKVFTSRHSQTIDGGKKELSVAYRCRYEYAPGVWNGIPYVYVQRKIRGNHLASVDDGRMGPEVAVMDGFSLTIDSKEFKQMATKKTVVPYKATKNKVVNIMAQLTGFAQDADEEAAPAGEMKQLQDLLKQAAPLMAQIAELQSVLSGAATPDPVDSETPAQDDSGTVQTGKPTSGMDAEEEAAKKKKEDDEKDGKGMDASEIRKMIKDGIAEGIKAARALEPTMDASELLKEMKNRNELADAVSYHVGTFDHSAMTEAQVAAYAVGKLGIPAVQKGQEVTAVRSFLHGRRRPQALAVDGHAQDAADVDSAAFLSKITGTAE